MNAQIPIAKFDATDKENKLFFQQMENIISAITRGTFTIICIIC